MASHPAAGFSMRSTFNRRVPTLTDGKQTPGMEVRFDTTVFAVGQ